METRGLGVESWGEIGSVGKEKKRPAGARQDRLLHFPDGPSGKGPHKRAKGETVTRWRPWLSAALALAQIRSSDACRTWWTSLIPMRQ